MVVLLSWVMIVHVTWKGYIRFLSRYLMGWCETERSEVVPLLKRNIISVSALEALGLEVYVRDGVLNMTRGSMVVLKGVRRNNLYH